MSEPQEQQPTMRVTRSKAKANALADVSTNLPSKKRKASDASAEERPSKRVAASSVVDEDEVGEPINKRKVAPIKKKRAAPVRKPIISEYRRKLQRADAKFEDVAEDKRKACRKTADKLCSAERLGNFIDLEEHYQDAIAREAKIRQMSYDVDIAYMRSKSALDRMTKNMVDWEKSALKDAFRAAEKRLKTFNSDYAVFLDTYDRMYAHGRQPIANAAQFCRMSPSLAQLEVHDPAAWKAQTKSFERAEEEKQRAQRSIHDDLFASTKHKAGGMKTSVKTEAHNATEQCELKSNKRKRDEDDEGTGESHSKKAKAESKITPSMSEVRDEDHTRATSRSKKPKATNIPAETKSDIEEYCSVAYQKPGPNWLLTQQLHLEREAQIPKDECMETLFPDWGPVNMADVYVVKGEDGWELKAVDSKGRRIPQVSDVVTEAFVTRKLECLAGMPIGAFGADDPLRKPWIRNQVCEAQDWIYLLPDAVQDDLASLHEELWWQKVNRQVYKCWTKRARQSILMSFAK